MFKKGDQQREQDSGNREKNSGADSRADVTKLDLVFPFCQRNRIHAVIQKAGYNLVSDMKDVNPQKLHMDICGINKKYKLELANPTVKDVEGWVEKI